MKLKHEDLKNILHSLDTDDTLSSAHGILCGFACLKSDLLIDDWLNEILNNVDFNDSGVQNIQEHLTHIFNETQLQLNDETLNFQLLIADEDASIKEQADTLVQWCQGFLMGLGLQKISTSDEEVLELIKDFSEISRLDVEVLDSENNAQDLSEIIEFVRMGVLLIQETLQPSKQQYVKTELLH
jgi:yecA family protein